MLKLLLLVTTMVFSMSSHAKDPNQTDAKLHPDFFNPPIERTPTQQQMDFFRVWLMDSFGKKVIQQVLVEKVGFDTATAMKTIAFMDKTINNIDKQAHQLYTKQQADFVNQYNKGRSAEAKASSFHPTLVDREKLLAAEARIQAKLDTIAEQHLNKLSGVIGVAAADDLKLFIQKAQELSQNAPPVDPDEYLKSISEPTGINPQQKLHSEHDSKTEFGVIKKDL